MKKEIKVITGYGEDIELNINEWILDNPNIEIIDVVGGGVTNNGRAICYIVYKKMVTLS